MSFAWVGFLSDAKGALGFFMILEIRMEFTESNEVDLTTIQWELFILYISYHYRVASHIVQTPTCVLGRYGGSDGGDFDPSLYFKGRRFNNTFSMTIFYGTWHWYTSNIMAFMLGSLVSLSQYDQFDLER
jgi:hypothetical protein